ncbi:unnamed protein product [Lactuca virosa]|uniref:Zinc finger GRF-type domain-containing protein n=1 Tax=Lactuca virosa TaxID=75947 RepID=A0AAU9NHM5_9ASTR|nr:unnamed protein product [Lactuca virosa]
MSSSSSGNLRLCGCGDTVGMWMTWTRKNPVRRFIGCTNYNDEYINYGLFRWIDPQHPNKWYREKMYELRAQANGEHIIFDAPNAPINFHVNKAPPQVVIQDTNEHVNGSRVEGGQVGIIKFKMMCLVCFFVGMLYA